MNKYKLSDVNGSNHGNLQISIVGAGLVSILSMKNAS
jgi:hypothetical protein